MSLPLPFYMAILWLVFLKSSMTHICRIPVTSGFQKVKVKHERISLIFALVSLVLNLRIRRSRSVNEINAFESTDICVDIYVSFEKFLI